MGRDATEYLDEYCRKTWGHTNWGYTSTYSKEELADESKIAEYELGGSVVIWKDDYEEEEQEVFKQAWCTTCKAIKMSSKADYQNEFTCNTCGSEVYTKQLKAEEEE